MSTDQDTSFGKLAVQMGYCTPAQLEEGLKLLAEVRRLGLDEQLGNILVKKNFLTAEQVQSILRAQAQKTKVRIDNFEIIEKIGQGGMGAVFKARQLSLDRVVALKILSPKLAADSAFCERFVQEARAVAKLSHPNIIVGIDVGRSGKYFYFAMEYVDGDTALRMLRRNGPFDEKLALEVAQQMAHALKHADRHGLVHRDIKPDNIMITKRGEAKLCDLGLAKLTSGDDASVTTAGMAVGTPHYIAPEQARGKTNVDIRADFYALGGTLYHLVTGETLFKGETSMAIMTQHLTDEAPNARKLKPELSDGFCRLIEKMLAKEADDRFANPDELIEEIENVRQGRPLNSPLKKGAKASMAAGSRAQASRSVRRTTGELQPVGPRGTTGPRAPIPRPDHTTAGPQIPIPGGNSRNLIFAGIVAAVGLLVLVGLSALKPDPKPVDRTARNSDVPPDEAKPVGRPAPITTPPPKVAKTTPEKAAEPPKSEAPFVAKIPPANSGFEPLDLARRAYNGEGEKDYARILSLYDGALKSNPKADLGVMIVEEQSGVRQEMLDGFKEWFKYRLNEAKVRYDKREFIEGLKLLQDSDIPVRFRSAETLRILATERSAHEVQVGQLYDSSHRKRLEDALAKNKDDPNALNNMKREIIQLRQDFLVPAALGHLKDVLGQIDDAIKAAKAAQAEAAEDAVQNSIRSALGRTRAGRFADNAQILQSAKNAPGMDDRLQAQLDGASADLDSAQKRYDRLAAWAQSKAQDGSEATVQRMSGQPLVGTIKSVDSDPKSGLVAALALKTGKDLAITIGELAASQALQEAANPQAPPSTRADAGAFLFWAHMPEHAYPALEGIKGDKEFGPRVAAYLSSMDESARRLIQEMEKRFAAFDAEQDPEKRKLLESEFRKAFGRLNRYRGTEAYRERNENAWKAK